MEATRFLSNSAVLPHHHRRPILQHRRKTLTNLIINGAYRESNSSNNRRDHYKGKEVDENMIVLRMRIQEMKMTETTSRRNPPSDWMEWEKKYYEHYNEDVLEAVGLLQNYLMGVRPSQALGLAAVVALSLIISSGVVISEAVEIVRMILSSGFHLI